MVRVDLDSDELLAADDNRLTVVEGRVDLVRRDLSQNSSRLDVVVARAAEDGDALINEKYDFLISGVLSLFSPISFVCGFLSSGFILGFIFSFIRHLWPVS